MYFTFKMTQFFLSSGIIHFLVVFKTLLYNFKLHKQTVWTIP